MKNQKLKSKTIRKIEVYGLPEVPNVCNQILREVWKSKRASIAHVVMRRGEISLLHTHRTFTEIYYILQGRGILTVGKKKFIVTSDTLVEIPPHIPHKLRNTGRDVLTHLVISTPAFRPGDVVLLEKQNER